MACWINDSGVIAGVSNLPGDQVVHATLWRNHTITDLGTLGNDLCSDGENINAAGQVVGSSSAQCTFAHTDTHGFLWENGGSMIDLDAFVPPGSGMTLFEGGVINDRGEILVNLLLANGDERTGLLVPCQGDDDGCQGENPTGVSQNSPTPIAEPRATATPAFRRGMLDRLRVQRFSGARRSGAVTGPAN
jgi:probable HAF family extracellular repeat protein